MGELTKLIKNKMKEKFPSSFEKESYINQDKKISFKADIKFREGKVIVFIEIEDSQPHPDTNVSKYWYSLVNKDLSKDQKILVIQIFGKIFFKRNYESRVNLCTFVAGKIEKEFGNFLYKSIDLRRKYGDGENEEKISDFCIEEIARIVEALG